MMAVLLVAIGAIALARPAAGAMTLSSLTNPTVQTLIDLGSNGATAGDARYYDFSYAASANGPAADAVTVQSVGTADAGGLRFVASWLSSGGSAISSTISYDVASLDGDPINRVNLLSNGTAPIPAARTFVTTTMSTATPAGTAVAPILTTYDDGRTAPTDVDSATAPLAVPQPLVAVTDTLTAVSGTGGLATASFVQNGFTFATTATVPEPAAGLVIVVGALAGRRVRRK